MDSPPPAEPTLSPKFINGAYTPIGEDHDEKYGVPTLEELG
jgi:cryptochrome